jgi:hypothetical protein
MKIYQAEIDDGLQPSLSAKSSISYASIVEKSEKDIINTKSLKALAGIKDKDLYYTQSILVTSSWNKNDDIFDKAEVWAAKETPMHKPTNLEHDEGSIVGHITSNWPMTEDGVLIDETTPTENLPNKFHILTGSVIYVGYTEPELRERAQKLIAEIEQGIKYVSMECFFKGFDYGLINNTTGEYKVLARNEETAFLTKYLRSYGGIGEHEGHKIGRVLRDITFSGKGFVNKPANPESIIFTKENLRFDKQVATLKIIEEKNDHFKKEGVFSNQANLKENDMSLENEMHDIKNKIEAMADCKQAVTEAQVTASDLKNQNTELENALKETRASLETAVAEKEEAAMKMKKMEEKDKEKEESMKKMKAELDAANEVLAAYKEKEAEMMKKEKKMKRMATLIENGLDQELATSTVEKFEDLDDTSFDGVAEVFAAMMMKKEDKKEDAMKMKKMASEEAAADVEILEQAEAEEEVDLSVGAEEDNSEAENTRAALLDFVYNRLGKNKGE